MVSEILMFPMESVILCVSSFKVLTFLRCLMILTVLSYFRMKDPVVGSGVLETVTLLPTSPFWVFHPSLSGMRSVLASSMSVSRAPPRKDFAFRCHNGKPAVRLGCLNPNVRLRTALV